MTQTQKKWESHALSRLNFWLIWRCHGILWVHFYVENDFRHCYVNFFESAILKVTWSRLSSKFIINSCKAHWQQHFGRHPTAEDLSVTQKFQLVLQRTLYQKSWHFTCFYIQFFSLQKTFNPVVISILDSSLKNFFTFWLLILQRSWSLSSAYTPFFNRTSKILMRLCSLF